MSNTGRMFTDDAVTRTLDRWLADGPREMPEASVESALRTVADTGQRVWRARFLRFTSSSPLVPIALTMAGIAAVVALGIGIGQVLPPPGTDASPTPGVASPTPEASGPPSGTVLYTNEEDGYEVTIPATWTPATFIPDQPGTMRFGAAHSDAGPSEWGAFNVSIGNPDGSFYACAPSLCRLMTATTIDEMDAAIDSDGAAPDSENVITTDVDVTLDGEPARLEYVTFRTGLIEVGPQFHHLYAIHDGRPVVLSFDKYAYGVGRQSSNVDWVRSLLGSFHFLDDDVSGMTSVTDAEAGYELLVPAEWDEVETGLDGVRRWAGPDLDFFISIGAPVLEGGQVAICDPTMPDIPDCNPEARVPFSIPYRPEFSLDYLTTVALPCLADRACAEATDLTLGGEAARETSVPSGDRGRTWITAIHNYRPVVLHWSEPRDARDSATIERMRASFRFLSEGSPAVGDATTLQTFRSERDGFEILVPGIWVDAQPALIGPNEYPGVTPFGAGTSALYRTNMTAMTVSVGDESGRIWSCGISVCELQSLRTQGELEEVAGATTGTTGGVEITDIFIGGVRGGEVHPSGYEFEAFRVAYGIVDGRPVMIRVADYLVQMGIMAPSTFAQIAMSFRFTD